MTLIIINIPETMESDAANSMIQAAFNQGFTHFLSSGDNAIKLKDIERCTVFTQDSSLKGVKVIYSANEISPNLFENKDISEFGAYFTISNKDDERAAVQLASQGIGFLVCKTTNWKIIPFENLIAKLSTLDTQLYADIGSSLNDADLLLHTLETGVDGLIFSPTTENDLIDLKKLLKITFTLSIESARIEKIEAIPEADRVCVDTSSMLRPGEGMLVGSTARGFALVHAEVFDSEFVNSRPFRVNAGDVSEYLLVPQEKPDGSLGVRTNYLSELNAGDRVLVVNTQGETRIVSVGRVKIETRPMLLFKLIVDRVDQKIPINACIQNAETVRLIGTDLKPISGTDLKVGDEVLVHVGPGATHFGTTIKETIIEK